MFYDLHVHTSLSIGENTVEEVVEMAKKIGLDGIGIVRYHPELVTIPKDNDIDIVDAVMVKAESAEELNEIVRRMRNRAEIIMVHGGNYDVNRAACENSMVDILCHPELGRRDSGLDHIAVKAAKQNDVMIEINFREILESHTKQRSYVLSSLKRNVMLCNKYDVKMITCSGAVSKWNMRSCRDMASIAHLLGLELGEAINTVSNNAKEAVERNRNKMQKGDVKGVDTLGA